MFYISMWRKCASKCFIAWSAFLARCQCNVFKNEDIIIQYRPSLEVWNDHTQIYRAGNLSQQKLIDIHLAIPQTYPIYVLFEMLMGSFLAFRRFWALGGKCHGPLARWVKLRVRMRHRGLAITRGFLWIRRRGESFPAFPSHAQPSILHIW